MLSKGYAFVLIDPQNVSVIRVRKAVVISINLHTHAILKLKLLVLELFEPTA